MAIRLNVENIRVFYSSIFYAANGFGASHKLRFIDLFKDFKSLKLTSYR